MIYYKTGIRGNDYMYMYSVALINYKLGPGYLSNYSFVSCLNINTKKVSTKIWRNRWKMSKFQIVLITAYTGQSSDGLKNVWNAKNAKNINVWNAKKLSRNVKKMSVMLNKILKC